MCRQSASCQKAITPPAEHQGSVEAFSYSTGGTEKTAYVYLPFGYETERERHYDILYFMHGGGGNARQFYNRSYALNDILDHAIENGEIKPLIVVTPTFYPPDDRDTSVANAAGLVSVFSKEFIDDLMPEVESRYRTYAGTTDRAGLEDSRDHRAFGGFSMGSVTTWYQFVDALDYVKYFMPLSGDCWEYGNQGGASHPKETAQYLSNHVSRSVGSSLRQMRYHSLLSWHRCRNHLRIYVQCKNGGATCRFCIF